MKGEPTLGSNAKIIVSGPVKLIMWLMRLLLMWVSLLLTCFCVVADLHLRLVLLVPERTRLFHALSAPCSLETPQVCVCVEKEERGWGNNFL